MVAFAIGGCATQPQTSEISERQSRAETEQPGDISIEAPASGPPVVPSPELADSTPEPSEPDGLFTTPR